LCDKSYDFIPLCLWAKRFFDIYGKKTILQYYNRGGVIVPKVEQKQVVINEIKEIVNNASSIVLVDYRGLTVEQDTRLRKELREAGVTYKVLKNSMMKFAFDGTAYSQLNEDLAGPSAIAISYEDPTAGPRVIKKNLKDMKALEFKSGVVEGVYFDVNGIEKVASIPSREELLSKLLGSLKSPISTFARTMKALAEKVEETGAATAASLGSTTTKTEVATEEVVAEVVATEEVVAEEVATEVATEEVVTETEETEN
jgi:large subunit ribosomal protein L10